MGINRPSFSRQMRVWLLAMAAVLAALVPACAEAGTQTIDLSPYVNQGFTNGGWFNTGSGFSTVAGQTTTGNQATGIPFYIANTAAGNNFWYGLNTNGTNLSGTPISVTIPVSGGNYSQVYVLSANTFGTSGAVEYQMTLNGSGGSLTYNYIGGINSKDYYANCGKPVCGYINAPSWFIAPSGRQQLFLNAWQIPANFGLSSITFTQVNSWMGRSLPGSRWARRRYRRSGSTRYRNIIRGERSISAKPTLL